MILYFLIASAVFCTEPNKVLVDVSTFDVAPGDKQVYVKLQGASYDVGSVWVRTHYDGVTSKCSSECMTVYYRSEDESPQRSEGKSQKICYMRKFSKEELSQGGHMKELLQDVISGVGDASWQAACAQKYKVSATDLTCAAVTALREDLTGEILYDGVQHPEFDSWARYLSSTGCYARAYNERKVVSGKTCMFQEGDMWIAQEQRGKNVLFYRHEFGPCWMCYRYALDQGQGWPKIWLNELDFLKIFARSRIQTFSGFAGFDKQSDRVIDVVRATISGRTARWNEGVWFAWRPQCEEKDPFLQEQPTDRLQQGAVIYGVYQPGSVWLTQLPVGMPVCRARYHDGGVFQIAQSVFPPSLGRDDLMFAPHNGKHAVEFIFGLNKKNYLVKGLA